MNRKPGEKFGVRYEKSEIQYATQFLVSPGKEEVLVDFSSGLLTEDDAKNILPIQTRLALPWSAVIRLAGILNQVVETRRQHENGEPEKQSLNEPRNQVPKATLPPMEIPQMEAPKSTNG